MLDDDKPDYFLADDDPDNPRTQQTQQTAAGNGKIIDFGSGDAAGETSIDNTTGQLLSAASTATQRKKSGRLTRIVAATVIAAIVIAAVAFYIRYCNPYAQDAAMRVYIVNVEKRGLLFKTYEAQIVSDEAIRDTSRIYSHPEDFTVADEATAHSLQKMQGRHTPVTIRYEKYYATLPWRGASKYVITSVE